MRWLRVGLISFLILGTEVGPVKPNPLFFAPLQYGGGWFAADERIISPFDYCLDADHGPQGRILCFRGGHKAIVEFGDQFFCARRSSIDHFAINIFMTIVVDAIDRLELFYPSRYNLSAANLVACDGYLYIIVFIEGNESAVNALGSAGRKFSFIYHPIEEFLYPESILPRGVKDRSGIGICQIECLMRRNARIKNYTPVFISISSYSPIKKECLRTEF